MKSTNRWLWLIGALLAGFVLMSAWSFRRAALESSAVTDADYYSHGLRYNQTLLERQAATSLGWQISPRLEGRTLTVQLLDRNRQPVPGASGTLSLTGTEQNPAAVSFPLREIAPGIYLVELPASWHGERPAEIGFERDGARLGQRLLLALR